MKNGLSLIFAAALLLGIGLFHSQNAHAASDACTLPSGLSASQDETAWRLFTAVNCESNGSLAWETWTEQNCIASACVNARLDAAGKPQRNHHLHGSHLLARLQKMAAEGTNITANECSAMTQVSKDNPTLNPFVPKNITKSAKFCEEVFVNDAELDYINNPAQGQNLKTLTNQVAFIKASGGAINFPTAAVEVKADWLPADALKTPFTCSGPGKLQGVYTEEIDGKCYALAAMHISSKLAPNWLWATFEPQSSITNPNRCNPKLYDTCNDTWGSKPAMSKGAKTMVTKELTLLMLDAKLPKEFLNYRLTGSQTVYTQPVHLGNSFVEMNAGVPVHQASCITCHSYAMVNAATTPPTENPNFGAFPGTPAVGNPGNPPAGDWQKQDFSWLLGIMPKQ